MADDDDDWVGEPPEGRYTRDRAKPEFWRNQRPLAWSAALIGIVILVLIVVIVAR
jgi:hypothetical protein